MITADAKARAIAACKVLVNPLASLHDRWQDEKEYEDFEDCKKSAHATLNKLVPDCRFVNLQKRPFEMTFEHAGLKIKLRVTSRSASSTFEEITCG